MNPRIFSLFFALILAIPCLGQRTSARRQANTEAEDKQAIEQLHQDDIEGNLAFDIDKIASTWDDDIVNIPPHSQPIKGVADNRAYLAAQRKTMANIDILAYEQSWDEVRILGDYAYEYGAIRSRIRPIGTDKEMPLEFNIMRILKRQPDGAWKIYRSIWNDRKPEAGTAPVEEKPKNDEKQ